MNDDSSERTIKSVENLLDAMYPLILDRLKNETFWKEEKAKPKPAKLYPDGVYYPELDYLAWMRNVVSELRLGRYHLGGGIKTYTNALSGFAYAVLVEGGSHSLGNAFTDLVIPSATLRRDIGIPHDVDWKQSYNNAGSSAKYLRGVLDGNIDINAEEKIKNSAAAYTFRLTHPLTQQVINNTRDQWNRMTPEEETVRIVSRSTMMALLDAFERGTAKPFHINWEVHITQNGETLEAVATRAGVPFRHGYANGGLTVEDKVLERSMRNPLKIHANHQLGMASALDAETWVEEDEE